MDWLFCSDQNFVESSKIGLLGTNLVGLKITGDTLTLTVLSSLAGFETVDDVVNFDTSCMLHLTTLITWNTWNTFTTFTAFTTWNTWIT